MEKNIQNKIFYFADSDVKKMALPERFTFPFYYTPHPLAKMAAAGLQRYLDNQTELNHNFGITEDGEGPAIGKMFGVLVVEDVKGKLGYFSAFSGKLAGSNDHDRFVPPVFDMLLEDGFFIEGQEVLNEINKQVKQIEADKTYLLLKEDIERLSRGSNLEIAEFKALLKANKSARKQTRQTKKSLLNEADYAALEADLIKQSLHDKHQLKVLLADWEQRLNEIQAEIDQFDNKIDALKQDRRERSAALQQQLFKQYNFLNIAGEEKSLHDIFSETVFGKPPSAAGECATPKLLQYAFLHGYRPIAMAEFWWGAPPKSEIRQHKQFYPACTGKCKPILTHMLNGMAVDDNPLLTAAPESVELDIVYQDDCFVIVNKPADLRSVPGVDIYDSVYSRLKAILQDVEPLIIHRLDMGTSGLLVVAKTKEAHKFIQSQFLKRTVDKRYTALLSKVITKPEGEISLPLKPDLYNRPRQLVCFEEGKKAVTRYRVIQQNEASTKVHFWPHTGRTHQLRMHAAHALGLNAPIVGDDLYGKAAERLYLHAAYLEFVHPQTGQRVSFEVAEDF